METTNIVLVFGGAFVAILGFFALVSPHMSRWISAPGGPRLKGIVAMIVGIILMIIGLSI